MKKNGFTLAEVLITLTIIGVVAVLTLPTLMANTREQQARTALRKMVNTMTMAAHLNSAAAGYDYSSITQGSPQGGSNAPTEGSLTWLLQERTAHQARTWAPPSSGGTVIANGTDVNTAVFFNDGTAIYFKHNETIADTHVRKVQDDGTQFGIAAIFDTNAGKGPNLLSNCVAGIAADGWNADNAGDCTNKNNRYIQDRFRMRLHGNFAAPVGAASTWMLDDTRFVAGTSDRY